MEPIIDKLLNRYETGTVSRRQLIQGLAMLATAGTAKTASAQGFEVVGFDHIQLNASNALESSEWYRRVLGLPMTLLLMTMRVCFRQTLKSVTGLDSS